MLSLTSLFFCYSVYNLVTFLHKNMSYLKVRIIYYVVIDALLLVLRPIDVSLHF